MLLISLKKYKNIKLHRKFNKTYLRKISAINFRNYNKI